MFVASTDRSDFISFLAKNKVNPIKIDGRYSFYLVTKQLQMLANCYYDFIYE